MSIKPSAAAEIRTLVAALTGADEIARESAIARLAVIGPRAVDRLTAVYRSTSDPAAKVSVLRVFEGSADPRTLPIALSALSDRGAAAIAAAAVLRGLLDSTVSAVAADAFDALISTVLDRAAERRLRIAAFNALGGITPDLRDRLAAALQQDPDAFFRDHLTDAARDVLSADAEWQDALEGRLGDDPVRLREVVEARAASAALSDIHRLIDTARKRESEARGGTRAEWRALRGALHKSLALRGSTVALYDLRESLDQTAAAMPESFIAALHAIGDDSCLESIATAYVRAEPNSQWRLQLAETFQAIVKRMKLSRRHPILKRIETRQPDAAALISTPSRTTPRRKPAART